MPPDQDITELLARWSNGDDEALSDVVPLVYGELRALARSYLARERSDHTLQATALVHELFIRLAAARGPAPVWQDRHHFFGIAARVMRHLLISHARRHQTAKRGAGVARVPYDPVDEPLVPRDFDLQAFDAALASLADVDPFQAKIVELRFLAGYSIEETAALLGCSRATVNREFRLARLWLFRELRGAA